MISVDEEVRVHNQIAVENDLKHLFKKKPFLEEMRMKFK